MFRGQQAAELPPPDKRLELSASPDAGNADEAETIVVHSRYGRVEIPRDSIIAFPGGLLGFPKWREFGLIELADPRYAQFRLLQSIDEHDLCFIVLPINPKNELIDYADIEAACKTVGIGTEELVVLLLVTVRRAGEKLSLSVNLRAPLLIDAGTFRATQHVLSNDRYPVRYELLG